MNSKNLISNIALKMNLSKEEVKGMLNSFIGCCVTQLKEDNSIGFQSFGTFEVVKREERLIVHPQSKERSMVPPKLVLTFRQSAVLKEKINSKL